MNIGKLKIGTRLGIGFASVLGLLALITGIGVWRLHAVGSLTDQMVRLTMVKERLISEWHGATHVNGARTIAVATSADAAEMKRVEQKIKATSQRISELQKQLDVLSKDATEMALYADVGQRRKSYLAAREVVFNEKKAGKEDEAKQLVVANLEPALDAYLAEIKKLTKYQADVIAAQSADVEKQYRTGQTLLLVLGGVALLVGIGFCYLIGRGLLKQLGGEPDYAAGIAAKIGAGDLAVKIDTKPNDHSSLLFAIKGMRDNLANIVGQVRGGTDTIATASSQIASGNQDLSARTEQQASALQQTASSMEELTSTVKQNADNARQANHLALSASEVASKGGVVVSQVVDTMGSINDSARKIVDIIGVIDGIAFQTNILALNAAVEAARAGEQGRGFAVVAAEVRNLAQRSAAAAKEIKGLIGDSVEKVDAGSKLVGQAGSTMDEIVSSIQRVTDIMSEITAASQEQSAGIEQVNQAIAQMDQATQQNAALVEQAAAAAESMQDQATTLAQAVSVFKLDGGHAVNTVAVLKPGAGRKQAAVPAGGADLVPARGTVPAKRLAVVPSPAAGIEWEEF